MFLAKKVGDFIEKESESLEFIGLEIPRDYKTMMEDFNLYNMFKSVILNEIIEL